MKFRIIIFAFMFLPFAMSAQSQAVQKFFESYEDNDDFTLIDIKGSLLNIFSKKDNKKSHTKITGIQLLSAPKGSKGLMASDVAKFERRIKNESFEDLITVRDKDGNFNFMMDESNGIIKELIMVVNGEENFTIMSLRGLIPLDEVHRLSEDVDVDIDGLERLKKN